MSLFPRQITLRILLFFVAIVALNCGAYRFLQQAAEHPESGSPRIWLSSLDRSFHRALEQAHRAESLRIQTIKIAIGAIPLLNVAMIGGLLYLARRFGPYCRECESNPRVGPAAATYFSHQFLALGFVIITLMPGFAKSYLETLVPTDAGDWKGVLDHFPAAVPEFAIKGLLLGALVSAPPLLLTWLGQELARRCAATLAPRRFWFMTGLVSFGFASASLAIWFVPRTFAEERDVELLFQVVDNDPGQPIGAAAVQLSDAFDSISSPPKSLTDAGGHAQLTGRFEAVGQRIAWRTIGEFAPWGRWLEISAPEYQTMRMPLPEALGPHVQLEHRGLEIVRLISGKAPESRFADIAGTYYADALHHGGCIVRIEADGEFTWTGPGSEQPGPQEYGYAKRSGSEIVLVPAIHPGRAFHPFLPSKLQVVPWGGRLYLSTKEYDELQAFCRPGLNLPIPENVAYLFGAVYLRESDRTKPRTGVPRLPLNVWLKFLVDELRRCNADGSPRLRLESSDLRELR
jgi:hypothetical protein